MSSTVMEPHTRAGTLWQQKGHWYRELEREDDNERICKTIMFKRKNGAKVAVLIPLRYRVSYKKLKAHFGEDCAPLSPDELRLEGFEPNECAPMLVQCELLVDQNCTDLDLIQTGSGTLKWGIEWKFQDLAKVKEYRVVDVKQETSQ